MAVDVFTVEEKPVTKLDIYERLDAIFNGSGSLKEKIPRAEKAILADDTLSDWGFGERLENNGRGDYITSRVFLKELTPYGFELISIMYKCQVEVKDYTSEEREQMYREGNYYRLYQVPESRRVMVDESKEVNAVYQLTYNLRDKVHRVVKNGKELKFREANMRNMFASHSPRSLVKRLDKLNKESGYDDFEREGMYEIMFDCFACIGNEYNKEMARFLERFMNVNKAELMYKSGLPKRFVTNFVNDLKKIFNYNSGRMSLKTYNEDATKPHQVLGIPKNIYKLVYADVIDYYELCNWSDDMQYLDDKEMTKACTKFTVCISMHRS